MNNLYEAMNTFLADQIVVSMKIHNIHWFMVGTGFFPMHEKLDEYYEEAQERIDDVAERLLVVGDKPLGSLAKVLDRTSIHELDENRVDAVEGIKKLIVDFEHLNQLALHIISLAEEDNDPGTADYFTGVSRDLGKDLWQLNAYIR